DNDPALNALAAICFIATIADDCDAIAFSRARAVFVVRRGRPVGAADQHIGAVLHVGTVCFREASVVIGVQLVEHAVGAGGGFGAGEPAVMVGVHVHHR